ncbi:hypothetical protein [Desulfogranum japonicum]|uniref:hypothetical protein n=1 Tax=Desulfogranum japonicum TaxID=231447 RepID=UPI0003F6E20D|nr:hypothetical protein [Desulfogranum japonicum]
MKKSPATVAKNPETTIKKQDAVHDNHDDVLQFEEDDFVIDKDSHGCDEDFFVDGDIAEGDVYNKEVPFADDLNGMQRNAVALHLGSVRREYAAIDRGDQQAVNDFWHRIKNRIHEDHGFMSKDTDAVMDVLRKNVESQSDVG